MDLIREHLMYKQTDLKICFSKLTTQEQYECIRLILASCRSNIEICTHEVNNPYILCLLKDIPVKFIQCWREDLKLQTFDLRKEHT